jgi:serine/threonine-protein kinase RsbW
VQYRLLLVRPGTESARLARMAVLGWLRDLGMEELAEKLLLIASELVANAALHAHTILEISMTADSERVTLGVRDEDERFPLLDSPGVAGTCAEITAPSLTESGRGLAIVKGLADAWGVEELGGGKRVWAQLALPKRFPE